MIVLIEQVLIKTPNIGKGLKFLLVKTTFIKYFKYTVIQIIISKVKFIKNILYKKTCHENCLSEKCKVI